jgi:hypothetical protein
VCPASPIVFAAEQSVFALATIERIVAGLALDNVILVRAMKNVRTVCAINLDTLSRIAQMTV